MNEIGLSSSTPAATNPGRNRFKNKLLSISTTEVDTTPKEDDEDGGASSPPPIASCSSPALFGRDGTKSWGLKNDDSTSGLLGKALPKRG